ncbi:MAG: DUF4330 domain-containing protein [Clostridia bacterium]|nr:DUF4330 domain-containing protein [Clostridia bacterium]
MKIIDDKGKLFGLINYLDLIVLLIVLLLAGKFFILDNDENSKDFLKTQSDKEILLTYYVEGVKDISVSSVKEGDLFRDVETKNVLGEVMKVEVSQNKIQTSDRDGNVIYSEVPDRYDIMITLKCRGNISQKDIKVSNVDVQIGRSMLIESKLIRFMSVVHGIEYEI